MKLKYILTIVCSILTGLSASAQFVNFPSEGVIQFEKRVNMFAIFKRAINKDNESYMQMAFDQYKKTQPQFKTLKSTLSFSSGATLYTPQPDQQAAGQNFMSFHPAASQPNTTYIDLNSRTFITQKNIFEQNFLVKDSIRNIKWKITDETREIAGYHCRRANAIVMDSIYVVAFYTDKIPVSGGPESFTGLPGMILGVALPHENITWFATSVTEKSGHAATIKPPTKGKPQTNTELKKTVENSMKDWGAIGKEALKPIML
ncbi:GLPGLI family protein [Desertivirga brevis]|uniref:GLPGLI family protein n=1 Tax=Desertivirga brevis TaxID=2810310 RepID=UPI001A972AF7|nr:GLPGLI family protein [Pedobacter sp. SYSU D00873]